MSAIHALTMREEYNGWASIETVRINDYTYFGFKSLGKGSLLHANTMITATGAGRPAVIVAHVGDFLSMRNHTYRIDLIPVPGGRVQDKQIGLTLIEGSEF